MNQIKFPKFERGMNAAIRFVLCKEIGDSLQVFLGNKLKESLPPVQQKSVCIFSCDKVVGMRARLLKLNALIKNYERDEEGALFDEFNLYLSEEENPTEIYNNLIKLIIDDVINYNDDVIRNIRGAIEEGFSTLIFNVPDPLPHFIIDFLEDTIKAINTVNNALKAKLNPDSPAVAPAASASSVSAFAPVPMAEEGAGDASPNLASAMPATRWPRSPLDIISITPIPIYNEGAGAGAGAGASASASDRLSSFEETIKQCKAVHIFRFHKKTHKCMLISTERQLFSCADTFFEGNQKNIGDVLKEKIQTRRQSRRRTAAEAEVGGEDILDPSGRAALAAARDGESPEAAVAAVVAAGEMQVAEGKEGKEGQGGQGGQGGGGEHWQHPNEIEGVFNQYFENKDLFEMIHNPNKLLEEKVWEYYGNKGDAYCYGLMNRMYHFFDYINEISIDKEILDLFANLYNADDSRIYLNKKNFIEFKNKNFNTALNHINLALEKKTKLLKKPTIKT
jgi:hypothetical protein